MSPFPPTSQADAFVGHPFPPCPAAPGRVSRLCSRPCFTPSFTTGSLLNSSVPTAACCLRRVASAATSWLRLAAQQPCSTRTNVNPKHSRASRFRSIDPSRTIPCLCFLHLSLGGHPSTTADRATSTLTQRQTRASVEFAAVDCGLGASSTHLHDSGGATVSSSK